MVIFLSEKDDILIIYGSPHKNSFTSFLLNEYYEYKNKFHSVFDCYETLPLPCTDCGYCKTACCCKFRDLDDFFGHFEKAQKIVFAFPIYNAGLPAPLKALIDRFQLYYNLRFYAGKKVFSDKKRPVTLIMSYGGREDVTSKAISQLLPCFSISGCFLEKTIVLGNTDEYQALRNNGFSAGSDAANDILKPLIKVFKKEQNQHY